MRKKASSALSFPVSFLVAVLIIAGCTKKEQQAVPTLQPKPAAKSMPPIQNQATTARAAGTAAQSFDFSNKKDPFKPFISAETTSSSPRKTGPVAVVRSGDLLPIQSYEVSKFKVSGIIIGLREKTALVTDPGGRGYVVKEGMLIGNNDGRISRITPSAIVVVEPYRDDHGRLKKRTITLTLAKKK